MLQAHSILRASLKKYVVSSVLAAVSIATTGAALRRSVHRSRGTNDNADRMPDSGSNPGRPAAVVRHQLGQFGSR